METEVTGNEVVNALNMQLAQARLELTVAQLRIAKFEAALADEAQEEQ